MKQIHELQDFFQTGKTLSKQFRHEQLLKLKASIKYHEQQLLDALKLDLNKPEQEAYSSEIAIVYEEINFALKNLKSWMKKQKVKSPITLFYSKSYIYKVPRGIVLIIAPWNYPIQLVLSPLIGAIAAGNCVVIKPSEYTVNVNKVLQSIISYAFNPDYVIAIEGDGVEVIPRLINDFNFNYVFFTGSSQVGKEIAKLCAEKLIPYTLELGGKSPVIIDNKINLDVTCKRLIWSKFFNAGQTCIAPDYVLIDYKIKDIFIKKLKATIKEFYPNNLNGFTKIINHKRFDILCNYIKDNQIIYGGKSDANNLMIEPTLVDEPSFNSEIMQKEIFGPILPIISFKSKAQLYEIIDKNPNPLSLYIFSLDNKFCEEVIHKIPFGGGGINIGLFHLINPRLPFGGIMNSGNGCYHGKYSFEAFSHTKSIVNTATFLDIPIKYPPYSKWKIWLLKKLFVN
ncbi:MAG TPA: aldehyde dehydrogenase family protein [Burkholderiales bacterium]|nr:aldehyde dehydrogenase family protein [Burkholderiales bacterium]